MTGPTPWPAGGPWIVAGTSSGVDWRLAAAALAAAAKVRVAVLIIGDTPEPGELLLAQVATWLRAGDGGAGPLTVEDVADLVQGLRLTHGLVLVAAGPGLLVPLGRGGWTLTDLAVALPAPVVVVTDSGPDAVNHSTLALGALAGSRIPATVVTLGRHDEQDDDHGALPVTPAGRIPAGAADRPGDFAAAAAGWLDPILHATGGRPKPAPPAVRKRRPSPPGRTVSGRRVVLILTAVFISAVVIACGLGFLNRSPEIRTSLTVTATMPPVQRRTAARGDLPEAAPSRARPSTPACPQNRAGVIPARADTATRQRVDAAWKRIEDWLAAHAAKSRRALRPPAAAARIDRLQRQMAVPFPADLVASLLRHDGVSAMGFILPPLYAPMSTDQILADWTVNCDVMADNGWPGWWDPAFVPFASAGDGGDLLADERPGRNGRIGEFYPENGTTFDGWPPSTTQLLEDTARSLETGRPFANRYRPRVAADGALTWDVV